MTTKLNAKFEEAYEAAKLADDRFQAALIKQFGKENAGTMRYVGSKHNAETKAAAEAYWAAANATFRASFSRRLSAFRRDLTGSSSGEFRRFSCLPRANDLDWTKLGKALRSCADDGHEGDTPEVKFAYSLLLVFPKRFGEDEWPADMPQEPNAELIAAYLNPDCSVEL